MSDHIQRMHSQVPKPEKSSRMSTRRVMERQAGQYDLSGINYRPDE